MVSVPWREAAPVLAATDQATVPLPEPAAPEVMVIQDAFETAVQPQPAAAVTLTVFGPPAEGACPEVALNV